MRKINDGGPVHPSANMEKISEIMVRVAEAAKTDDEQAAQAAIKEIPLAIFTGITLRDYFAAHAMSGLLASDEYSGSKAKDIAEFAYSQADDMIAVREKS